MKTNVLDVFKRVWPLWVRILAAIVVVFLVFKVYAGWHWSKHIGSGPGVTFSPTHTYVGWRSAMTLVVETLQEWPTLGSLGSGGWLGWRLAYLVAVALPAGVIAVCAFEWITRRFGPANDPASDPDSYSRCRRCSYILNGLSQPRCPECGERI